MDSFEVTCINKPDRYSQHEHITHIGNIANNWRLTREDAIRRIEAREAAFYTVDKTSGRRVPIEVVREFGKAPFLRTRADGKWSDNLLALQECGASCKIIG